MDLKGKVIQILPIQTGMGKRGQWKKQEFVIETQSQYPKKVCLSLWGDKIDQYNLAVGETVNVSVDLESREYKDRWFTEARAWKIDKSSSGAMAPPVGEEPYVPEGTATDDLPF